MTKLVGAGVNSAVTKKQVLINVDLKQVYKQGVTSDKVVLNDLEQVIYNYFVEKLGQDHYRNTLNEFQQNISKKCIDAGYNTTKNNEALIAGKYVFITEKSIKKALLKINLEGIDKKFNHSIKSDISKAGNCYIKSVEFDNEYITEKQDKTLTEKQEQAKKEKQAKKDLLYKVAEFNINTLDNSTLGAGAIQSIFDVINEDKKDELLIKVLETIYSKQAKKQDITSSNFNLAYIVCKTSEFKRLLAVEKKFHELEKQAGATATAGMTKKQLKDGGIQEIPNELL